MTPEAQANLISNGLPVLPFNIWTDTQAVQAGQVHSQPEAIL